MSDNFFIIISLDVRKFAARLPPQFAYLTRDLFYFSDIKIITKEVYDGNAQPFMNWTARAGNFIEESRAFIDRYLGRGNTADDEDEVDCGEGVGNVKDAEVAGDVEGETSVTSGEEVWGTPTSGGENDDMQIFGSIEQTHSVS